MMGKKRDYCVTCGRVRPDHAEWCMDVREWLASIRDPLPTGVAHGTRDAYGHCLCDTCRARRNAQNRASYYRRIDRAMMATKE
jgi:hypothetical protein